MKCIHHKAQYMRRLALYLVTCCCTSWWCALLLAVGVLHRGEAAHGRWRHIFPADYVCWWSSRSPPPPPSVISVFSVPPPSTDSTTPRPVRLHLPPLELLRISGAKTTGICVFCRRTDLCEQFSVQHAGKALHTLKLRVSDVASASVVAAVVRTKTFSKGHRRKKGQLMLKGQIL